MICAVVLLCHLASGTEKAYLGSDISWLTSWTETKLDSDYLTYTNGSIEINGEIFQKGIVAHAPSSLIFDIGGVWQSFHACIGISKYSKDPACGISAGEAQFRVLGDGVVLRDWDMKGSPESTTCFDIDISSVKMLILDADPNWSLHCDFSTWAEAYVSAIEFPTDQPSMLPTEQPSMFPTDQPSLLPTEQPSMFPTKQPSIFPSEQPPEDSSKDIQDCQRNVHEIIIYSLGTTTLLFFFMLMVMCFHNKDTSPKALPAFVYSENMSKNTRKVSLNTEDIGEL